MPGWTLLRLYGRSRGLWIVVLVIGPALVAACALAPRTVPLLLGDNDQRLRVPAVIGLLVALAVGPSFARGLSEAEWIERRTLRRVRLAHLTIAVVLVAAAAVAVAGTPTPSRLSGEVLFNGLGLVGICLLTVTVSPLPPWIVSLAVVGATYVVGSDPTSGRPYAWAWLLWTDRLALKAAVDVALFAAGSALFLLRPGRVSSDGD